MMNSRLFIRLILCGVSINAILPDVSSGLDLSDINSPTKEGLRIVGNGTDRLLIAGQNETSTVKASCRFLEELGCRYFMDNALGEVYPRRRTLSVGRLNISESRV